VERIPFEPIKRKKKAVEKASSKEGKPQNPVKSTGKTLPKSKLNITPQSAKSQNIAKNKSNNSNGIPKTVSDRMIRRSFLFCGIPTGLGFAILIASYVVVSQHIFELPNTLVLLASLSLTGVGVIGLSYGALSASWDENRLGSWLGAAEFQKNFSYLTAAWKNQNSLQRSSSEQDSD
jgi:Photosynthesis affected mutant 68